MSKYIDADKLEKTLWDDLRGYRHAKEICAVKNCILEIQEMHAADVVKVVRCKDCLYNHNGVCTHSEIYDDTKYNPEYYCADGERRVD